MSTIEKLNAQFDDLNGRCRKAADDLRQRRADGLNGVPAVRAALVAQRGAAQEAARKRAAAAEAAARTREDAEAKAARDNLKARDEANRTLERGQADADITHRREHENADNDFDAKVREIEATIPFLQRDEPMREARRKRDAARTAADLKLERAREDAFRVNQQALFDAQEKQGADIAAAREAEETSKTKARADEDGAIRDAEKAVVATIADDAVASIIDNDFKHGLADLEAQCEAQRRAILEQVRAIREGRG